MNIDALPHNQDWLKTMFWDLPPYNPDEIDDLDQFQNSADL